MDNAMVKRGIGAVVLAIIAALLLGWLLKDKSQERQDMVEMKLPGAPEMNIPSLTGTDDTPAPVATLENETTKKVSDSVKNAGSAVVAAATGAASKVKDAISSTTEPVVEKVKTAAKPGFAIRPSGTNEQREVVDNVGGTTTPKKQNNSPTEAQVKTQEVVVASTTVAPKKSEKAFTPSIVEEKKKTVKKKVAKVTKKQEAKKQEVAPAPTTNVGANKYSIQLLATSSQSRANKLAKTMKSEGYNSFITKTSKNNKVLFRVRLGGHDNRSAALKAQKNLKRRYQKNFFVQNSLVVSN